LVFKYAKLWDGYNKKSKTLYGSILIAFFVGGFVQSVFSFDNITTFILYFLMLGFINNNFCEQSSENSKEYKINPKFRIILILAVSVCMIWILYVVNLKPTIASIYFINSVGNETNNVDKAF
jgi:hypothetical protein